MVFFLLGHILTSAKILGPQILLGSPGPCGAVFEDGHVVHVTIANNNFVFFFPPSSPSPHILSFLTLDFLTSGETTGAGKKPYLRPLSNGVCCGGRLFSVLLSPLSLRTF